MTDRPTLKEMRDKALSRADVKAEYDALSCAFEMKQQMIALRKAAGLSQAEMAERLGTKRSNISRLESLNATSSPSFATIENYARVLGYSLRVGFEPARNS
ncbi:MAG: helix-turn-helix domain-containing protein [Alphaproteobacteria bacterium]